MASTAFKNWNALSVPEKLDLTKKLLKIDTDTELCKILNVTRQTLRRWYSGTSNLTPKHMRRLYDVCNMYEWGSDLFNKDVYISQFTTAYDAAKDTYERIILYGDDISKSNAVHSVAVKIAYLLSDKLKKDYKKDVIVHMHSIFGADDYGEIMNIQSTDTQGNLSSKKADICIKIGSINKSTEMVYIMECIENGILRIRRGGYISDTGIMKLVLNLTTFFKK